MHENPKLKRGIFFAVFIIVFGSLLLFTDYGILKRLSLEYERNSVRSELDSLSKLVDSLNKDIIKMRSDTFEIEKIAREKYGMVKPNEQIFFVIPDTAEIKKLGQ